IRRRQPKRSFRARPISGRRESATELPITTWISIDAATSLERGWSREWSSWPKCGTARGCRNRAFDSHASGARLLGEHVACLLGGLAAEEVPRPHDAFSFDFYQSTLAEHELVFEELVHRFRHLDSPHRVGRFHPGRDVDGVAPHVV